MLDEEGRLAFSEEQFHSKLSEWGDLFREDRIPYKTVVWLPNLIVPAFPLRLNNEILLDRLTDDEVTCCAQAGVFSLFRGAFRLSRTISQWEFEGQCSYES